MLQTINKTTTDIQVLQPVETSPNYDFPVELQPVYFGKDNLIQPIPNRQAVVRTDTHEALGVVSDGYGLVLHKTIIDQFREAGKNYDIKEKILLSNNGANLFYTMTFPSVQAEVVKGDIVKMMMIVKNSYNGSNSLQVIFGAFRLACSNGMIIGTKFLSFNFRHVGMVGGVNGTMVNQYKEAYANYIELFGEKMPVISQMAKTQIEPIFDNEKINLPAYLLNEAKVAYDIGKDKSLWGYYNSLTFAVTHKMKTNNSGLAIDYGVEAWKAAEQLL